MTLQAVTLQGGWAYGSGVAADGGAIYNQGTLRVGSGSTLSANAARYYGGDIYNLCGGTVTVSSSTMFSNISGGGTYNDGGTLTLSYSTLSNGSIENHGGTLTVSNSTRASVTGISNYGGTVTVSSGSLGGIVNNGGMVTVSSSTSATPPITAGRSRSATAPSLAAPAFPTAAAAHNDSGTVTVSDSTMSSNNASYGGDLYNAGADGQQLHPVDVPPTAAESTANRSGTLTVSNSTLSGNYATPDYSYRGGYGGGIFLQQRREHLDQRPARWLPTLPATAVASTTSLIAR